jgi:hypothetical protein
MLSNSEVLRKREEALRQSLYSSGSFRSQQSPAINHPPMMEMMGSLPQQGGPQAPHNGLAIEMPGDMYYSPQHQQQHQQSQSQSQSQSSPNLHPSQHTRGSVYSELSGEGSKPSSATHENSYVQDNVTVSSGWGGSQTSHSHSPNPEAFRYSQGQQIQQSQQQGSQGPQGGGYQYNPQHFAQDMSSK